ncbi:type I DNA topoisomerase [Pseudoalteromonas rubra]|uniref:DNA topoisomerase family protein n=1 Tax=Pseudoalteromonas rubra TaxID=43658 RepID=UPI002DB57C11|nr:topoisomerase DNA-binding C4 zinc finger domain-containing protein [Pseudoalteromonas rubra]MEC4090360.1 topoisomerase DNA-binding C4 zinc finger domain-containing protein [Pseudoalteromonas rubra]
MSKIDHSLFNADQHALEREYEVCPKCGSELVIKHSKSGPFLGCASYPACDYIRAIAHHDNHDIKVLEDSACPLCSEPLVVRNGRYGMFIGCTGYPQCHYIAHDEEPEEAPGPPCPKCHKGTLHKRKNKYGKFFYACDTYPQCKYNVNHPPIAHPCEACGWPVMVQKHRGGKAVLQCPQKVCQHTIEEPQ